MELLGTYAYDNLFADAEPKYQIVLPVKSGVAKTDLKRGMLLAWETGASGGLVPLEIGATASESDNITGTCSMPEATVNGTVSVTQPGSGEDPDTTLTGTCSVTIPAANGTVAATDSDTVPAEKAIPFGILAEDLTGWKATEDVDKAPVWISGAFNKAVVQIKSGTLTNDVIVAFAKIGIRLISIAQ